MILVDTSVWIDHLRANDARLVALLQGHRVMAHPFVIGEIALGNLRHRSTVLTDLRYLPQSVMASDDEVLEFLERHALCGSGIGYIDAHLLASVHLTPDCRLLTHDRRLRTLASKLGVADSGT
jgi:predicted nucleic acid-binding protein